ncbi:AraC family transcriptional regulator [Streptomyces sp. NPDC091272]|uniref:helix-turn-helix transcriptional regulator n=1 Tax=Streptomyces sp. NPDC091272 TaxID=3365981 RepID=UPI0037FEB976
MNPTLTATRAGADGPSRTVGFLSLTTLRGTAPADVRAPEDTGSGPNLLLALQAGGEAELVRGEADPVGAGTELARRGGTEVCGPGDLFACDGAEPFVLREFGAYEVHLVRMPRRSLVLTARQEELLYRGAPFADGPVAPLLAALVRELANPASVRSPREALRMAGSVAELTPLLVADAVEGVDGTEGSELSDDVVTRGQGDPEPGGGPGAESREILMRRLYAYIDAHLWDRDLTPASVAAAQHLSIRYLHKLFEGHGRTIGRWIQHRRLEEARRELARPSSADSTVSAVSRRWGFASPTHFSRSFRAVYGMSPSDWRDGRVPPPPGSRTAAHSG